MDFTPDARAEELRAEVRQFLREHWTPEHRSVPATRADLHDPAFHSALAEQGWLGPTWPREQGGQGWDRGLGDVLFEELASAAAPIEMVSVGQIILETIRRVGTEEQKERLLAPFTRGEILFAMGYSEPGAGSDLASVRTRADRDGDGWLINGQKVFTTGGHLADYVFLLTRTDTSVAKHAGMTLFLVPTATPGFSFEPIHTLSGQRTNVTYYSDVRIPDSARVGEVGGGWQTIVLALAFERGGQFAAQMRRVVAAATEWGVEADLATDANFCRRLGRAVVAAEVSRLLGSLATWSRETPEAGSAEGSMAKVYASEALVRETGSLLNTTGPRGLVNLGGAGAAARGELQQTYRESHITTVYGGSNEVLRGLIARKRLKLPRT